MLYEKEISPKDKINYMEGKVLEELLKVVNQRKRDEGEEITHRDIEGDLQKLNTDFLDIARQNRTVARKKYRDEPGNVFEDLVNRAFLLLDFDTIPQRSAHGWDIVLIAGRAVHPYFIVVECKTAAEGTYSIEHDYYEIWERILKRLGKEFVNILKETSFSQIKNTELKEDLLRMLKVK